MSTEIYKPEKSDWLAMVIVSACLLVACTTPTQTSITVAPPTTTAEPPTSTAEPEIHPLTTTVPDRHCQAATGIPPLSETGYLGIHPGVTQRVELINILGRPQRIEDTRSPVGEGWIYENAPFFIMLEDDTVTLIDVQLTLGLQQVLDKFGCPTFVERIFDDIAGESKLGLVYIPYGVLYAYPSFPAAPDESTYNAAFFKAGSLDEFLRLFIQFSGKTLVELEDAIK